MEDYSALTRQRKHPIIEKKNKYPFFFIPYHLSTSKEARINTVSRVSLKQDSVKTFSFVFLIYVCKDFSGKSLHSTAIFGT